MPRTKVGLDLISMGWGPGGDESGTNGQISGVCFAYLQGVRHMGAVRRTARIKISYFVYNTFIALRQDV